MVNRLTHGFYDTGCSATVDPGCMSPLGWGKGWMPWVQWDDRLFRYVQWMSILKPVQLPPTYWKICIYIYSSPQHGLFMIVHDSPYWKISSPLKRVDFKPFAATAWITRVCLPLFTAWSAKWCHCIWILTNLYHCWLRMRWWTGRFTGMLSGSSNATYFFPLKPAQWNWEAFDLTLHRLIDFLQKMWSSVKVRLGVLNITFKNHLSDANDTMPPQ